MQFIRDILADAAHQRDVLANLGSCGFGKLAKLEADHRCTASDATPTHERGHGEHSARDG